MWISNTLKIKTKNLGKVECPAVLIDFVLNYYLSNIGPPFPPLSERLIARPSRYSSGQISEMEKVNLLSKKEVKFLLEKSFAQPSKRRSTRRLVKKEKVRQRCVIKRGTFTEIIINMIYQD